jgi:hypothetical protein
MTCAVLLAELVPEDSSSRTSPGYSPRTVGTLWPELFRDWPASGSLRSGRVYGRPTSAPPTFDAAGSGGRGLPTPTAQAGRHGATRDTGANAHGYNLWDLPHLLPTPTVMDMGAGRSPEDWDAWTAKMRSEHKNGNGHGRSLSIEVRLLPTPTAQDGANTAGPSQYDRNTLPLNTLVVTLGGSEPTPPPSNGGNGSRAARRQTRQ